MLRLDPIILVVGNCLFTEFEGALTENFISEGLLHQFEEMPRYWQSDNMAEVGFLIQHRNSVIPVEVKSDENVRSKSLTFYRKKFTPEFSIRFSMRNLKRDENLVNIPLFMVDYTKKYLIFKYITLLLRKLYLTFAKSLILLPKVSFFQNCLGMPICARPLILGSVFLIPSIVICLKEETGLE